MDERQHVTKSLTDPSACVWETPRKGQRVLASFTCWPRATGPLKGAPDVDAARNKAPPLCKVEKEVITVDAPPPAKPPFHNDEDGLDEWLLIPRPSVFRKPEYIKAVDAALLRCKDGERIIYETVDGFVVDVEIHEILAEKNLIESPAGFTRTQRLRTSSRSQVVRPPSSGCVVRGTLKVLRGTLPSRSWFGLGEHDAFSCKLGDGLLSEGFVACLIDIKQGSSAKCTISGECLLPDICTEKEQHAIVPAVYWNGAQTENIYLPEVVLEVSVDAIDDTNKKRFDPMTMTLQEKEERSIVLKERGTALYKARRFRRAESVWHEGVRLFGFWKPEDSAMDPHDAHLRENNRLRALSNPLLLNEALLMRRRGAFKEAEMNCDEVVENDPSHAKAFFRRGQVRVDLQKWEDARSDFRRALECGAVSGDVEKELNRLRKLERQQDAKDGKALKHTFDLDRPSIYDTATSKGVEKALRDIKEDALRRKERGPSSRKPVTKTSSQGHYDWTTSYAKQRPAYTTTSDDRHEPVVVEDLAAEIEDISDEEEEARRRAKQDYYNAQIALGNMRVQLPKPGEEA